jgi:methylmalonyl-CoA mutase
VPGGLPEAQLGEAEACLAKLRQAVTDNDNVFAVMMEAARHCSLGQISNAQHVIRVIPPD